MGTRYFSRCGNGSGARANCRDYSAIGRWMQEGNNVAIAREASGIGIMTARACMSAGLNVLIADWSL